MADGESCDFPILKALQNQLTSRHRFHVPAHSAFPGEYWGRYDLTELPGLDHLFAPRGCIARAQELAADVFRAGSTYFLVNGSSCGLTAAIFSQCSPGDTLIMGRNSHRSAAAGLIFSGVKPEFIPVGEGPAGIPLNVLPHDTEKAVQHSAAKTPGLLITSPNYWGVCSNLGEIAGLARKRSVPLFVDEAHGGHFLFHQSLPACAALSGADLWVNSAHKTLGALTPGSYMHLRKGALINTWKLEEALAMVQTSSPPYPVLLSLDLTRGWLRNCGNDAFESALETAFYLRYKITQSAVFQCLDLADLPPGMQLDPLRLTLYWEKLPFTGYQLCELLSAEYRIEVEMAGAAYLVILVHPGMGQETAEVLIRALREIEKRFKTENRIRPPAPYLLPPQFMSPREAMEKEARLVPLDQAAGCVAAQLLTPFPPGAPVLYPGEEVLSETVERIAEDLRNGIHFQDMIVSPSPQLRVVSDW